MNVCFKLLVVLLVTVFVVFGWLFLYQSSHEIIHVANSEYAGCSAVKDFAVTQTTCPSDISNELLVARYNADVRLEFFDYVFWNIIGFGLMLLVLYILLLWVKAE